MNSENFIKSIIEDTLDQVQSQGWDLLDTYGENCIKGVEMVYEKIKENYLC